MLQKLIEELEELRQDNVAMDYGWDTAIRFAIVKTEQLQQKVRCENCKWWDIERNITYPDRSYCNNEHATSGAREAGAMFSHEDFGCKYWKERE